MAETGGYQRICIVGCSGTGKSTLARQLGQRMGLPVHHLDVMFWKPGWVMSGREEEESKQREVVATERWIIDGNFGSTMSIRFPRADAIIWLDFPTWLCVWGVVRRVAHEKGRVRPDMAQGCTERWDWEFMKWVIEFNSKHRWRIPKCIEQHGSRAKLFHITRRAQLPGLLANFGAVRPAC